MIDYKFLNREDVLMALNNTKARYQAIVSNIPGIVCQFTLDDNGDLNFTYISDKCHDVLGAKAEEVMADAAEFLAIMNERDRRLLRKKLHASAETLEKLDWEGRIWIDGWQDTKWVSLRATTTKLPNDQVVWDGIMLNITDSKKEKEYMEQSRRDINKLNAHLSHVKEQERTNIAREIHDDLGGNLTAIKMSLGTLLQQVDQEKPISRSQLEDMEHIVDRTFDAVHRISGNLRPSVLDLGIVDALEWQLNQFKKQVEIDVKFITNKSEVILSNDQATALFRVCQEALSNVAKYAKAKEVELNLKADANTLRMTIEDNGVGIQSVDQLKENAFGLMGMRERISVLNGRFDIISPSIDHHGTKIIAEIPL